MVGSRKTTPFEFYQFWLNQQDGDVVKFLKYFTFLSHEEIDALAVEIETQPHLRVAHKHLAEEVTRFVHGQEALDEAIRITEALFTGEVGSLTVHEIEQGFRNMPQASAVREEANLAIWLVDTGIVKSRREAREFISNGAITLNGTKVTDVEAVITPQDAIGG